MKKLLLILFIFFSINIPSDAFSRKELIQEELNRLGFSKEIISETIELDKKYFTSDSDLPITDQASEELENLLKKNKENYFVLEKLLEYDGKDKKYYKRYMELENNEAKKFAAVLMYLDEKEFDLAYKKIKEKYPNTIIEKMYKIRELLRENSNHQIVKKEIYEILEQFENTKSFKQYNLTEEDIYYNILLSGYSLIILELGDGNLEKAREIYFDKIIKSKFSEEVKEYLFRVENGIARWMVFRGLFIDYTEKEFKKISEELEYLNFYKRIDRMYNYYYGI